MAQGDIAHVSGRQDAKEDWKGLNRYPGQDLSPKMSHHP